MRSKANIFESICRTFILFHLLKVCAKSIFFYFREIDFRKDFSKLVPLIDTGRKLNVHRTFRKRPGRLLNVLCTFSLRPVSTGI